MARGRETPIVSSVLDRLIQVERHPTTYAASVRALKESIRRDMEDLLNTRRSSAQVFAGYPLARASVVNYGLDDLSAFKLASGDGGMQAQRAVERCLAEYEPRLRDVHVEILRSEATSREIRLHIKATIPIEPNAETVTFDSMLDLASGLYLVE